MGDGSTALEPSVLKTIKKMLGLSDDYIHFDLDIIVNINTIFSNLTQMGIGPITGTEERELKDAYGNVILDSDGVATTETVNVIDSFSIDDNSETWEQFFAGHEDADLIQQVKSYMFIKVKLLFDPPSNGNLLTAYKENAKELEVRLYTQVGGY